MNLDRAYWQQRYEEENTPWDASRITTPLKAYIDQLENKALRILIPGAGNAHEAAYLHELGFEKVYVCDWAQQPLDNLQANIPNFPPAHLLCADFFELPQRGDFDLILEQTFFCALPPALRAAYPAKCADLLADGGKLCGLFFNFPLDSAPAAAPPYGGSEQEYRAYLESHFSTVSFSPCYNSIKPRANKELWLQAQK